MDVGRAVEEGRPQMGAGGEGPGLSEALSSYWTARDRFLEAGLRMNRSDPAGGLAEALIAAALWPLTSRFHGIRPSAPPRAWLGSRTGASVNGSPGMRRRERGRWRYRDHALADRGPGTGLVAVIRGRAERDEAAERDADQDADHDAAEDPGGAVDAGEQAVGEGPAVRGDHRRHRRRGKSAKPAAASAVGVRKIMSSCGASAWGSLDCEQCGRVADPGDHEQSRAS